VTAGHPLPLLFASDGQVNAMIPYGIPVNAHYQLVVSRGSSISAPEPVTLAGAQPAIFTTNQSGSGQGAILDLNNQLVQPGNPAHANDVVVMYCESLGDVNPAVPAGTAAPGSPPALAANPVTVTIGGVNAVVEWPCSKRPAGCEPPGSSRRPGGTSAAGTSRRRVQFEEAFNEAATRRTR